MPEILSINYIFSAPSGYLTNFFSIFSSFHIFLAKPISQNSFPFINKKKNKFVFSYKKGNQWILQVIMIKVKNSCQRLFFDNYRYKLLIFILNYFIFIFYITTHFYKSRFSYTTVPVPFLFLYEFFPVT